MFYCFKLKSQYLIFAIIVLVAISFLRNCVTKHVAPVILECSYDVRKQHVMKQCSSNSSNPSRDRILSIPDGILQNYVKSTNLLVDEEHRVVYCYAGKAASSTFKRLFIIHSRMFKALYGSDDTQLPRGYDLHLEDTWKKFQLRKLKSYSVQEIKNIISSFTKVLTTRHPMRRIFSFYLDKMKRTSDGGRECYPLKSHLASLVNKMTDVVSNVSLCDVTVSFTDFAEYFAQNSILLKDNHLRPIVDICKPCFITYDYVFRVETAERDQKFLLERIFRVGKSGQVLHENQGDSTSRNSEAEIQKFTQNIPELTALPRRIYDKLSSFYAQDMKIFGYESTFLDPDIVHSCRIEEKDKNDAFCC